MLQFFIDILYVTRIRRSRGGPASLGECQEKFTRQSYHSQSFCSYGYRGHEVLSGQRVRNSEMSFFSRLVIGDCGFAPKDCGDLRRTMGACGVDGFRQIRGGDQRGLWGTTARVIRIMV